MSRFPRHRLSGLTKALLLLGFILVVVWSSAAWANVRSARAQADRTERRIVELVEDIDVQAVLDGADVADLRAAAADFRASRQRLRSPLLRPVRPLPVLGRQLRSGEALLQTTADLADATADAEIDAGRAAAMLKEPGASRLEGIRQLAGTLRALEGTVRAVDLGPRQGLFRDLGEARALAAETTVRMADQLSTAAAALEAGVDLLVGPSRYLLLVANNAEMRAGSGSYLSLGVVSSTDGRLQLQAPERAGSFRVPPGIVQPEADVAARWGWLRPTDHFQSLMLSPRFDASAPAAARMWELAGQAPVDGVLAVDVGAVVGLLRAIEPVRLEGVEIRPASAQVELLHGQYVRFPDQSARQDGLQVLAAELFERLTAGQVDLPALADGLALAVRGRHLMAWSDRPDDQALWDLTGAHGRLTEASLLVSSLNFGSNKMDPHLKLDAQMTNVPAPQSDGTDHELRITITNASPRGDPRYVVGPNIDGLQEGEYFGLLAVNLPGFANQPTIEGEPDLAVYGSDGPSRVIGIQYHLLRGESRVFIVRFATSGIEGWLRLEPSSRLPGIRWDVDGVTASDDRPMEIRWSRQPEDGSGP